MRQLVLDLPPLNRPSLDNFIAGDNLETLTLLEQWVAHQGEPIIYLWGELGSGKSHLLSAIKESLFETHKEVAYIDATGNTLIEETYATFLIVDDVHRLSASGAISLFNRFNERREKHLFMLFSGDAPPHQLPLLADLTTRLSWGLVLKLHPLSDEDKIKALQEHAKDHGFQLNDELVHYLLSRWQRDIRSLIQVVDELNRWSLSLHKPITIPLAREALHNLREQAR